MDNPYDSIVAAADGPDPNREALADPRVKSFLDRISKSEGADYNTLVGGSKIDDLSRHPNRVGLTTAAGPSTAFGRYQITGSTDRSKLAKYSHLDYSPENQDLRAVELLRQTKALDAIQQDDDQTAMQRAGREWASIPNSTLPGRKNTAAWNSASAPTSSTNPYDSIVAQADVPTPQRQAQPLPAGLDELSATAAEMNPDASAPAPDVQTSLSAPVTQPVPIQASDKDRQWHLGVTPDEYAKLTRKQKRQVDAAAAYGVNSDNEKRAKGQTEFTPDVNYQNAMRRAVGLPHIGLDPGFNFNEIGRAHV